MRDFHKLGIWQRSHQLTLDVYKVSKSFPKDEFFGLTSQIRRAASSIHTKTAAEVMPEMVAGSDIILGNEEVCEKVFGIMPQNFDAEKTNGAVDQSAFRSICEQMMQKFPRCKKMVVTLRGAINANHNTWGGVLFDGKNLIESRRYDITDIVDRVGGGDSFMGGFIFGLLHYENDKQALEFAKAASCLKHTLKGDFNWVTVQEVENLMKGDTSGRVKR